MTKTAIKQAVVEVKETLHKLTKNYNNNTHWDLVSDIYVNDSCEVFKVNRKTKKLQKCGLAKKGDYLTLNVFGTDNKYHNVLVHPVIYSALTGKKIRVNQAIHHVDGNSRNNLLSNLKATTLSNNLKYFFHNTTGENDSDIANTRLKYSLDEMMGDEFWVSLPQYNLEVSSKGGVKRIHIQHGKKEATMTANIKYPTNIIVGYWINGKSSSVSLSRLYALAFYDIPEDGKFKVLIKNENDNLMNPLNYYISIKKHH